jgi:outer membrane lipoprotein SlyB
MTSLLARSALALLVAALAGCGPDYSPNTYASTAVQQANKVEQGVVVGVRQVDIAAPGTTGALAGAAAGGIAGSQATEGVGAALTALGGSVVGGILGTTVEKKLNDTFGFEYIVRKANGDMVSVTQKDETPLALGTHVLVIAGNQARIVPDYTVPVDTAKQPTAPLADPASVPKPAVPPAAAPPPSTTAVVVPPPPTPTPPNASPMIDVAAGAAKVEPPVEAKPLDTALPEATVAAPLEIKPVEATPSEPAPVPETKSE